jgi:hypothetical protein
VIVLDGLALFMPDVLRDCVVAAEHLPLGELIELLALVGRPGNGPAHRPDIQQEQL